MRLLVTLFVLSFAIPAAAQSVPVGSCEKGTASRDLETDALRVRFENTGQTAYAGSAYGLYTVPKDLGTYPVESIDLWMSGVVADERRTARGHYLPGDFWPGPLADADAPPSDCAAHDRIWSVRRADVERYRATGEATADLAEWPAHLGAPVLDGDGDPTTYDLAAGDQPDLLGDAALFWVTNDAGNAHGGQNWDGTAPLGVEVRAQAFAFDESPDPRVARERLRETVFVRYHVVNRRDVAIDSVYLTKVAFGRTGAAGNDYLGTDTLRQVTYIYNRPGARDAYGDQPASWGLQVIDGPVGLPNGRDDDADGEVDEPGERLRLSSSPPAFFLDSRAYPTSTDEMVRVQQGLYPTGEPFRALYDGSPWLERGDGTQGEPTVFAFPGDPAQGAFWSEMNTDGEGQDAGFGYYREMIVTTGPFRLEPGASATVTYAMPFARAATSLAATTALREAADQLLAAFGQGIPPRPVAAAPEAGAPRVAVSLVRPNPSAGGAAAVLTLREAGDVEAVVFDALGRRVAAVAAGPQGAGTVTLAIPDGLSPGAYVLRVRAGRAAPVGRPFVVVR